MNKQSDYQQALDSLRFTQEQKARLAARAVEAARQTARKAHRPFGKIAVLAACLAVVLAVGAGATGVLKTAVESFGAIFGGGAAQTEVIDKIGHPIGASDTADFQNLRGWDEAAEKAVTLVEGHWKFRFDVDYEDLSVTLGGGETFQQDGMTFTVDSITVSPVAVKVDYTVDSEVQWSNAPSGREDPEDSRQMERYFENVEILLTKTDGTVIDMSSSGGSIKPEHGVTVCSKGEVFEEIIPLEELASISVGGIAYQIG